MSFTAGTHLGPYEITALIGEGGMGEVYRATDTNLKRSVAIKVLPESVATDRDRLARFRREAEVLASLNHPNIAAIYGLERSDGATALVMELVEGPTLADRIAQGPIPIDEAMLIAKQIAEALEAAHEQGIIHRDLKPANIKLRPDGVVKVLDFGLAKALDSAPTAIDASHSPTITSPAMMTGVGVLLGTAAYMSPEQARGRAVDRRSDIWAFGCVLYEMLTSKRVFGGEDVSDTLAFVLTKDPDWSALPNTTPRPIRRLLRRSLEKDRKRRLSDIADARLDIDDVPSERDAVDLSPSTAPRGALGVRERLGWAVGVLLAVAIGGAAMLVVLNSGGPPDADTPEMRVEIVTPSTSDPVSFAISPDDRYLAFVGESAGGASLWLRSLEQITARLLPGTEGAAQPFWAPDSQAIGFFAGGKLKRVDIRGGMPRTLADAAPGFGGAWNADGVILFASTSSTPLVRVSANGGEPVAQTKLDPPRQVSHGFPMFLPGGREFLFYARGNTEGQGVYLGSLDAPETRRLISVVRPPVAYVSPGGFRARDYWLLYMEQETLMARRVEPTTKAFAGEPVAVADSVTVSPGSGNVYAQGGFSATPSGLVAYRTGVVRTQLTWFVRSGQAVGTFGARDEMGLNNPEISPDGRQVAARRIVENNQDIFLMDGVRTIRRTFDAGFDQYAVWSPDGGWLAWSSAQRKGVADLYRKRANGSGSDELLWESPYQKNVDDWSPDGRFLLYNEEDPVTLRNLWVLPLDGGGKPFVFLRTNFQEHRGQFSPDGRFVAYVSNEPGQHEIFVRPFPASDNQWQISTGGGVQPRWSHDGKELYYIAPDGNLMATTIAVKDAAIEPGTPKVLFQMRVPGGGTSAYTRPQFDVSSDGRFLVNTTVEDTVTSPITLILNWNPRP